MEDTATQVWSWVWTLTWFVGLSVFSVLSVLVIIFGGYDLAALLKSLAVRHGEAQAAEAGETPPSPEMP
ncbi:MAG: hypothetical protein FJX75_13490 [Armatimonadetes bacterium]|nr:hypothetical protein [Armatimonadota bacterium]